MTDHIEQTTEKTLASSEVTLTQAEQLLPGNIVAEKYQIISLLGRGGMGAVYRVKQIFLDQDLALKVLAHSSTTDDAHVRRFQIEGKAAFKLNHPNLVKVTDLGLLEDHAPYLVMEFIEGMTLAEFLKKEKQPPIDTVLKIIAQAALGLAYAHQNSVVHRDVKPSNIMLVKGKQIGEEGSVKIVDFGIAKVLNDQGEIQTLTQTGEVFGSPYYMSPEQCSGTTIDHRTDVYSLGCVLFEALTGTPPHVGQNPLRTMMLHQTEETPSLQQASMGREFPPALETIVKKMLGKEPSARYQDLGLVANDLANIASGKISDVEQDLRQKSAESPKSRRLKLLITASALILIAIAGWQWNVNSRPGENSNARESDQRTNKESQPSETNDHPSRSIHQQPPPAFSGEDSTAMVPVSQLSGYSTQLRDAKPFIPVTTSYQGQTQVKFEFPACGIGEIGNSLNSINSNHKIQFVRKAASGTVYLPVAGPYGFTADVIKHPQTFLNPSVLEKFDKVTLNELGLIKKKGLADESEAIQGDVEAMSIEHMLKIATTWKNLQLITLSNIAMTDQAIRYLNEMKNLRAASFGIGKHTKLLPAQPFIKQLTDLSLLRCNANDCLVSLSHSKKLSALHLKYTKFSPNAISGLRSCPNLQTLGLAEDNGISDAQLNAALGLPHLKRIEISWTPLTKSQIEKIEQSNSRNKKIFLTNCRSSEDGREITKQNARSQIQDNIGINN